MAQLGIQNITLDGLVPALVGGDAAGDQFTDDGRGRTFLYARNTGAAAVTLTFTSQLSSLPVGATSQDVTRDVAASDDELIGPIPKGLRDEESQVFVGYSDNTIVDVAAVKLGA